MKSFVVFIGSKTIKAFVDAFTRSTVADRFPEAPPTRLPQLTLQQLATALRQSPQSTLIPLSLARPYCGQGIAFADDGFQWGRDLVLEDCTQALLRSSLYPLGGKTPVWVTKPGSPDLMVVGLRPDGVPMLQLPPAAGIEI